MHHKENFSENPSHILSLFYVLACVPSIKSEIKIGYNRQKI